LSSAFERPFYILTTGNFYFMGYFEIQKYGRMNLLFRRNEVSKGILARLFKKEQIDKIWKNKAFVKEMERRIADYESGKDKGYTWEEAKEMIKNSLSEIKNKNNLSVSHQ
jgi:putative addiction module component (TIGR02574 family)